MKKALKLICSFSIFMFLLASCGGDSSKNNTLEATKKQGLLNVESLKVYLDFQMLMKQENGRV